MHDTAEVLILGGGPAGATAATLLARAGVRVELWHRPATREAFPDETMVPGAGAMLERLGLDAVVRTCGGLAPRRTGIRFGTDEIQWRERGSGEHPGWRVERARFDVELRRQAADAGAVLREIAVLRTSPAPEDRVVRATATDGQSLALTARQTILATGRATSASLSADPAATTLVDVAESLPETVALAGLGSADPEPESSVIEAVAAGWWWWLPGSGGRASLALFVDAEELRTRGRAALWEEARRAAVGPARSASIPAAWSVVATPRRLATSAPIFLVGDAAAAIDPLSSQGLEKALASAEFAAAAVRSALDDPTSAPELRRFLTARDRGLFAAHASTTLEHYAGVSSFAASPFWRRRRDALEFRRPPALPPWTRLRVAPDVEPAPVFRLHNGRLVPSSGYRPDAEGEALDRIANTRIEAVLRIFAPGLSSAEVDQAAASSPELFVVPPRELRLAIEMLRRRRFLVEAGPLWGGS